MSNLNKELIKTLTELSRIACPEDEQEAMLQDLASILNYIEQLSEIDTENIPPCNQVLKDMCNVLREDDIGPTLSRESFLANAPDQIGGLIRVPTVIKKKAP